ncbi:MAG: glycosyltransferase [Phycisphaerales bacterium]|nr:glycosyltransferase [Phycisphaerales bacterium]
MSGTAGEKGRGVLGVVIVNYRTAGMVSDCIASLVGERVIARDGERVDVRAVVVDNASGDGSLDRLQHAVREHGCGDWVRVHGAERNGGFAYGNNVGTRVLRQWEEEEGWSAEAVWYLNPDTLVRSGVAAELVRFLRQHSRVGVVGSGLVDSEGIEQAAAHRFPSPAVEMANGAQLGVLDRWLGVRGDGNERSVAHQCDWVSGASLMAREAVIRSVGGWNEEYFLYFEEVDLCKRVRAAGWEVWCEPGAKVVHLEGSATGIGERTRRRARYWFDSRRRFFRDHYGTGGMLLADFLWLVGRGTLVARSFVRSAGKCGRPVQLPRRFASDLVLGDLWSVAGRDWWGRQAKR